ncbi:FAD-dependent tricarballylate dehydrogenase TcuA [Metallosphaera javensis (ex Hofmann et al. 2022)]|uniref:FAD-dependent tricarballylate dehydrogenase TcuA n=1 Tax=Metallosphaera javensis (ex Hofmann et al. 2022) TaxID=99938 RepID=UPI003D161052
MDEYDIIVIGGGNAALVSAITSAENGKKVLLLERAPKEFRGGNSKFTRSIRYVHEEPDEFTTREYTEDQFIRDIINITNGQTNLEISKYIVKRSEDLPKWMENHKVKLKKAVKGAFHYSGTNAFIMGGGGQLIKTYYEYAEKLGVRIIYNATVRDFILKENLARGVIVNIGNDEITTFGAKAVIVASGGFEGNLQWLSEFLGSKVSNIIVRGVSYNDGLPLKALYNLGAIPPENVKDPRDAHWTAVDARAPKFNGGFVTRIDLIPIGIVVNKQGKRFYDEGEDLWIKRYVMWGRLVLEQPDQIAYVIIDSTMLGESLIPMYSPIQANTINELAKLLNIEEDNLLSTITQFNDSILTGCRYDLSTLDECSTRGITPPKSHWAKRISTPPFYAWPLRPGITFTYMGVKIGLDARVINKEGKPFENIYAAGELTTGNVFGKGYLGGTGLVIGSITGMTAGEEASKNV